MRRFRWHPAALLCAAACTSGALASGAPAATTPGAAVEALLAADRAFSAASAGTDLVTGISAMFADDVVMPLPTGQFAESADAAVAALRANPANATSRAEWVPIRGGVSADGEHGFTFGYMTIHGADGTTALAKYLAYWVRGPEGWRVAAYKRAPRPAGEVSLEPMPPALPPRLVSPSHDPELRARFAASLGAAERAFSDEAQEIGLGPAFAKHGSDDAVNMGRGPAFTVGAATIGAPMDRTSSPVTWGPDRVIVASSGDLGVTIGRIRLNAPPADASRPSSVPFFTIWRRSGPSAPWRYVAE